MVHGWYKIDPERVRQEWLDPTLTIRDMGEQQGVSGEAIRQAGLKLGLPNRRRFLAGLSRDDLIDAEVSAALVASREHDGDEDTPLAPGRWVLGDGRVMRWLPAAEKPTPTYTPAPRMREAEPSEQREDVA